MSVETYHIFKLIYQTNHGANSMAVVAAADDREASSLLEAAVRTPTAGMKEPQMRYLRNMGFRVGDVLETGFYSTSRGVITHQG